MSETKSDSRPYEAPEVVEFGSIVDLTGHCSSGCGHDSWLHPDEYKASDLESDIECEEAS